MGGIVSIDPVGRRYGSHDNDPVPIFAPMKNVRASIDVMPHDNLLDPQGKAVTGAMGNLGLPEISGVRIGKHITLHVEAADKKGAEAKVDEACKKLLANQIMEKYSFSIEELA